MSAVVAPAATRSQHLFLASRKVAEGVAGGGGQAGPMARAVDPVLHRPEPGAIALAIGGVEKLNRPDVSGECARHAGGPKRGGTRARTLAGSHASAARANSVHAAVGSSIWSAAAS